MKDWIYENVDTVGEAIFLLVAAFFLFKIIEPLLTAIFVAAMGVGLYLAFRNRNYLKSLAKTYIYGHFQER